MRRLIFILCFAAVSSVAAENDNNILKNLDVFELEVAADPQISPDGSQVVYVRRSMDIMTDRPVSNLWIIDADGSNHRPLLSGRESYSSPRWSPSVTVIEDMPFRADGAGYLPLGNTHLFVLYANPRGSSGIGRRKTRPRSSSYGLTLARSRI